MIRKLIGDVYTRKITLDHTHSRRIEENSVGLSMCWIYTKTQDCYVGNQSEQTYLLKATNEHDSALGLPLVNVDLSDLFVKAATANAEVHIIGTYLRTAGEKG